MAGRDPGLRLGRDGIGAPRKAGILHLIGPGLLVAATGVGAGDLATGAFTGSEVGLAVLWAVVVGAFLKFVLTEGLARWQIATGETLLEGAVLRLGLPVKLIFGVYLLFWSYFVGTALISACGVTAHAMIPVFEDADTGKVVYGILLSFVGIALVRLGGFRLFEKVMGACIALMFVTVVVTAALVGPDLLEVVRGFWPRIPDAGGKGLSWTVALMGGVGGTLTVLCYGYWIREEGRDGKDDVKAMRIDLGVGYAVTMIFGLAMVVIGSTLPVQGEGSKLIVGLAGSLAGTPLGEVGRWVFLIGAFGAVFSSLLGVWQAVPYVFADFLSLLRGRRGVVDTASRPYRLYLYLIGTVPIVGLFGGFKQAQRVYAVVGALFIPLLAAVLLILNGRIGWVGRDHRNRPLTTVVLAVAVALFLLFGWLEVGPVVMGWLGLA